MSEILTWYSWVMSNDVFGPAIAALRGERDAVVARVRDLEADLEASRDRLGDIDAALVSLTRLQPHLDTDATGDAQGPSLSSLVPRSGRIRTPRLVAEIVTELGPMTTRDSVIDEAKRRIGTRISEWSDPRNVVTVALNRAAEQGLVVKVDPNHYSPVAPAPDAGAALT